MSCFACNTVIALGLISFRFVLHRAYDLLWDSQCASSVFVSRAHPCLWGGRDTGRVDHATMELLKCRSVVSVACWILITWLFGLLAGRPARREAAELCHHDAVTVVCGESPSDGGAGGDGGPSC